MNSRHRDPRDSPSLRAKTPCTPHGARLRISSEPATPRRSSGSVPGLIVTRGLYKVLEEEMQERPAAKPLSARCGGQGSRPNFLFCYLCGLQFSSISLPIHQPQCYVKKLIEWERMDPVKRGPRPMDPEEHGKQMKERAAIGEVRASNGGGRLKRKEVDRFNEAQLEQFNTNMLVKCENCGRTFFPDRLEVHQRSCKPGAASASRPVARTVAARKVGEKTPTKAQNEFYLTHFSTKSTEAVPLDEQRLSAVTSNSVPTERVQSSVFPTHHRQLADGHAVSSTALKEDLLSETLPCVKDTFPVQAGTEEYEDTKNGGGSLSSTAPDATQSVDQDLTTSNEKKVIEPEETLTSHTIREAGENQNTGKETKYTPKQSAISAGLTDDGRRENPPTEDALPSAGSDAAASTAEAAVFASDQPLDDFQPWDDDAAVVRRVVKIPLNNVSRFKHVASRLQVDIHRMDELPRCRFCNRTFKVGRLEKHEDVCLERNKPHPRSSVFTDRHMVTPAPHGARKKNGTRHSAAESCRVGA
ncbi:hypothetical protein TraAM80_00511 [Trypanosoma rangeli]|uniref:C2HC/C3H-type domain-containing protein n=1 Tax=Trypanosoma rangeli TaxID=5698 RepID=A0A3R7KYA2_TRYRA|nr:uncharacterized protein TraAM80_00511 [Trypanosoma rangeli]RNF12094.1 hypothetical protein TraAM80_00511 [Trypanosoma rangeli]|eukprot:RNF12094.1 hypothetical protein TraAM80_00511 [Trypanosoma rangeli]